MTVSVSINSRRRASLLLGSLAVLALSAAANAKELVTVSDCAFAISRIPGKLNSECKKVCEDVISSKLDSAAFNKDCALEHWSRSDANDRVYPEGSCYNQWVYGYSDEGGDAPLAGFKTFDDVATPAECQEKCQMETECVNFLWRGIGAPICVLKNEQQVEMALQIKLHLDGTVWRSLPSPVWSLYCNTGLDYKCNTPGHYECLECDGSGSPSCVWESHHHIAGSKNCGHTMPICGSLPEAPEDDHTSPADDDNDSEVKPSAHPSNPPAQEENPSAQPSNPPAQEENPSAQPSNPPASQEEETATGTAAAEGGSTVMAVSAAVGGTALVAAAGGAGAFAYTQSTPEVKQPIEFTSTADLSVEYTDRELHADVDAHEFVV